MPEIFNGSYAAKSPPHTPGHHLPLAVTFGFATLSGSKRQLYGDKVGTRFGSTRP